MPGGAGEYKNERVELFLENHLNDYDIICFQEVFSFLNHRRAYIISQALKEGFLYSASQPNPDVYSPSTICGGLLIISRFPIKI